MKTLVSIAVNRLLSVHTGFTHWLQDDPTPVPLTLQSMQQQGRLYLLDLITQPAAPSLRVDDLVLLTAEPPTQLQGGTAPPALHILALVHRVRGSHS